jgi:hypothetical protein
MALTDFAMNRRSKPHRPARPPPAQTASVVDTRIPPVGSRKAREVPGKSHFPNLVPPRPTSLYSRCADLRTVPSRSFTLMRVTIGWQQPDLATATHGVRVGNAFNLY